MQFSTRARESFQMAADVAGIDRISDRRRVMTDMSPELTEALSPATTRYFLEKLGGHHSERGNEVLWNLGNALFRVEDSLRVSGARFREGDGIALRRGIQLLEDAFYRGSLSHLGGEDAAVLSFVVNRIGKLKETGRGRVEVGLDRRRFQSLMAEVDVFAKDIFSPEALARQHGVSLERLKAHERELESYRHVLTEVTDVEEGIGRIESNVLSFFQPGAQHGYFQGLGQTCRQAEALARQNFSQDPVMVQILGRLALFFEAQGEDTLLAQRLFAGSTNAFLEELQSAAVFDTAAPLDMRRRELQQIARYLRRYAEGHRVGIRFDPEFAPFRAVADLLEAGVLNNLPPFVTAKADLGRVEKLREQLGKAKEEFRRSGNEERLKGLEAEHAILRDEVTAITRVLGSREEVIALYERSRREVERSLDGRNGPAADLYLFKTYLVACDLSDRVDRSHGHPFFVPQVEGSHDTIGTYHFMDERRAEHLAIADEEARMLAHYRTSVLPWMRMLVEYQKSVRGSEAQRARLVMSTPRGPGVVRTRPEARTS